MSRPKRRRREPDLAHLRVALEAENRRRLAVLAHGRDLAASLETLTEDKAARDTLLAFEIVIAIAERESFMTMPAERIPVVLDQLHGRLLRLARLLNDTGRPTRTRLHAAQTARRSFH